LQVYYKMLESYCTQTTINTQVSFSLFVWDRPQKRSAVRRGGLSSADILQTRVRRIFQMRTSALFGAKNSDFSKFMVCPEGLSQCGHFADKEKGCQFFAILYGRPLSKRNKKKFIPLQPHFFLFQNMSTNQSSES